MVIRTIDKISYSIFFPSQWQFASKSLLYMHIISLATMRLLVNVAFLSLFLYLLFALSYINFSVVSSQSSYVFFFSSVYSVGFISIVTLTVSLNVIRWLLLLLVLLWFCWFVPFFRPSCVYKLCLIHNFCKCIPI